MKKVLIMEDELNIRSFVVINLKRAGYDAIEAGNGQALDLEHPDILCLFLIQDLCDLNGKRLAVVHKRQYRTIGIKGR